MPRFAGVPVDEPAKKPRFAGAPVDQTAPLSWGGTAVDAGQSLVSGVRQGIESSMGGIGDANSINGRAASWLAEKLGASPETAQKLELAARFINPLTGMLPSSGDIRQVTEPVIGAPHAPETVTGEYARTIGEFLPGAVMGPGRMATKLVTQALIPGLASEAAGQATKGSSYEPYARVAGALAGAIAPSALRRLVTPLPISPQRQALVDALHGEGVDLTAGQTSGRNALKYAESELGGGAAANFSERQGEQFTSAALQRAGINAPRATPEVMDHALTRIGQQFDDLAARNAVIPDPQMGQDLGTAFRQYNSVVPESQRSPIIQDMIGDITAEAARGPISGEFFQRVTSRLAQMARGTNDVDRREALQGIRSALDDAMERSIQTNNPADLGAWQEARTQYRNLLVLEKAATGAGENAAQGIISPSQLRNATVTGQGRRNYARGQGDFADLARAGEGIMKPLPQSGTAPRTAARNLGTGTLSLLGAGGGAAAGGPLGAMAGMIGGAAIPYVAGRALLSAPVRNYLSNQLMSAPMSTDPRISALIAAMLAGNQSPKALPSN